MKLAEQQHEFVQQGQVEELLLLLTRRQAELDQLAAHERVIAPAKKQWSQFVGQLPAALRAQADALMAETRSLLERITSADKNDVLALQQQKLNVGQQLGKTTAGRTVNRAYAASAYGARPAGLNVQR
jgi:hypothetical protein